MKKIIQFATLALMCSYASGIGIDWGVEKLDFGTEETPALATSITYGNSLDQYVLQLVFVGTGSKTGDNYDTLTVIDTGTLATFPVEVPGVVAGKALSTQITDAGTYVMLLYNNHGGYYSLSASPSTQSDVTPATIEVSEGDLLNTIGFFDYTIPGSSGSVYRGALVPEPSTAALALAGIALLFRRKRS